MGGCASKKGSGDSTPYHRRAGPVSNRESYYDHHPRSHQRGKDAPEPPAHPKPENARTEEEKAVLKVKDVDFNVFQNALDHHTESYESTQDFRLEAGKKLVPQLVVRRGQPFDVTIQFDRNYNKEKDDLKLIFDTGKKPIESKGTRVVMMLSDVDTPREWGAKVVKMDGSDVTVRIFTPPNCIVSKWTFKFDTILKKEEGSKVFRYTHAHPIYLLFNPWCPDDQVYMDDEKSRDEYVLNDRGRIYRGTAKQIGPKPWNFGQFEDFMIDCCFYLLDKSELSFSARGNPILVCRKISAMANAPDDSGVLIGNWSGDYSGGSSPLAWMGSVGILEQYWKTLQPVKFGQCWVFSGVVTSICRCLGVPARSVTNFASAHDVDASITIDQHWTADGQPMDALNSDSVWNFHVWNDVWMARPDLPSGFGGWQAIDATPQETSDGVYCAGPCSIEALKNGLVNLPYDGPFIFAEVNADRINWLQEEDGTFKCVGKVKNSVGKCMSTKSPYTDERQDITYIYKFPEGTQQERTAVWRAVREGSTRKDIYEVLIEDMAFDLHEKELVMFGEPFDVSLKVTNTGKDERNVKLTLTASVIYYTGIPVSKIKTETFTLNAPSKSEGEVVMTVKLDEYLDKLVDMCNIKISCMAQVLETKQFYCDSDDFRLAKPELIIKAPAEVKVGEEYDVEVSFTNPLPRSLSKCEFSFEGAGLQKPKIVKQKSVSPHGEARVSTKMTALRAGTRELVVGFDSKELADISGQATVKVVAAS